MKQIPQDKSQMYRVRVGDLDADTVLSLDKVMRPTRAELGGMLQSIRQTKRWPKNFLAALLCIQPNDMRLIEEGHEDASGPVARLIWFFYMMDKAPEVAFSVLGMATWGKGEKQFPAPHVKLSKERRAVIVAEIGQLMKLTHNARPHRMKLVKRYEADHISYETMKVICAEAGYRPPDARRSSYRDKRIPPMLRPESLWLHMDWRMSDKALAEKHHMSEGTVLGKRTTFRKLPTYLLKRHVKACGVNPDWFETIFGNPVKVYRRKPKNIIPEKVIDAEIILLQSPQA